MADVFISYSRKDRDVAHRLDFLCRQEGWSTWIDLQIALGQDFRPEIEREIDAAACVVVIWTPASVSSSWVRYEATHALKQGKLVEMELAPGLASQVDLSKARKERNQAIVVGERVQVDPAREELLARMAAVGRMPRPRDSWNASLVVTNWQGRPPSHPIIAWEWVGVGGAAPRIIRRERWFGMPTVEYRTTIGNFWQFGYEGAGVPIGYLTITDSRHEVTLPERDKRREGEASSFVVPFSYGGTALELLSDVSYPSGGVRLGARADELKADYVSGLGKTLHEFLSNPDNDGGHDALIVQSDNRDKSDLAIGVRVDEAMVWCELISNHYTRDESELRSHMSRLFDLGWKPLGMNTDLVPVPGVEKSWWRGKRLTNWWVDLGLVADLDCEAIARLIVVTFQEITGSLPFGHTHAWSSAPTRRPARDSDQE